MNQHEDIKDPEQLYLFIFDMLVHKRPGCAIYLLDFCFQDDMAQDELMFPELLPVYKRIAKRIHEIEGYEHAQA